MSFSRALLVTGLAALVLAPYASAQEAGLRNPNASTPTVLYFHLNGFQDFPINTQKPDDRYAASEGIGLQTHSTSCVGDPTGQANLLDKSWHTYYGYSSPGYVEYNFEEDGKPRYHPERGFSFDVNVDTGQPWTLYWYLETSTTLPGGDPDPNQVPVILPQVSVKATIRTGDGISVGDESFNAGDVVAEGIAGPADLIPTSPTGGVTYQQIDGRHVYGFPITLDIKQPNIPKATGYNVRIDVYMDNPFCNDPQNGYFMPNFVHVHTSSEARPRMELAITNPIRIEYIHPQFVGDDMVIHTSMNSPWGNYDVDEGPGGIELKVSGPSPATSLAQAAFVQRHHEHNYHQQAVDSTYVWPYKQDRAADGLYTVDLSVWNDQRTAQAFGTAQFEIGSGLVLGCGGVTDADQATENCEEDIQEDGATQSKDSPGIGALALVGALAGAALVALRRRA